MAKLKVLNQTPAALGYTFPAEWEPQSATWFSWPRPEGISFPGKYHTIPENLARIMCEIQSRQAVRINVPNENWEHIVRRDLKEFGCPTKNVFFHPIKTNESWCRDHGPAFVVNRAKKKVAIVDWGFNAWGGKYPPYDDDDAVPTRIAKEFGLPVFYPTRTTGGSPVSSPSTEKHGRAARGTKDEMPSNLVIMEGGSVDFNGAGTVLTTTDCLLNKNRNPDLSKQQVEQYLKDYYGQSHVAWLTGGIEGDDTDGHIDDLARFLSPTKLVMGVEPDTKDDNHRVLKSVRKQVDKLRDQDGRPFEIIQIPMPKPVVHDGQRLPATYVNFLFINGALLVPTFRDRKNDKKALSILQDHLPKHKVIGIDCTELIWGLGAIHCLTQQQPKV
ncbi:MAG TPA: agmatine deiminase family protein [Tepidisphaeraceae bacterium]|jgi:agmatine deiminase|nr:agmatine deiminase family protein [Tepidisphaeraceae bacterium]